MPKRRGQGEGSIYPQTTDASGKVTRWAAYVNLGTVAGKRKRVYVYGSTRKEVADKLRKLQQDAAAGNGSGSTSEESDLQVVAMQKQA